MAADAVKIVHIDPFSGAFQELGDRHFMATQFAVDEIMRIVNQTVHSFRSNPSTDSDSNRPSIPIKSSTCPRANRPILKTDG